ncbi:LiaI-LiaF-like domain-containing protein [Granulicella arctica]|uniref:LiaI-LiaF-like domain-containing protein n=1 Tax=Granulicella arctica TaxID=940613 RepID=UPI0021E07953|nr:DUF5668 domain-containing protein [Granulicella arctica]
MAARLAAADTATSASGTPYGNVNVPYGASAVPLIPGAPNPALAGLLGLIPGVGAMYNGQYAKGVVHLVIFAVLVSLSNNNGLFGLFVAGWVFYQVFEAYHTARARRDGTPLPNPFGLNDIGEKLGFNKSWTATAPPPPGGPTGSAQTVSEQPFTPNPQGTQGFVANDGTRFTQSPDGSQSFVGNDGSHFKQGGGAGQTYGGAGTYSNVPFGPPNAGYGPSVPPYVPTSPYNDPDLVSQRNRFPVGAILLIAFGVLFFFGSTGWFHNFPVERVIPFILIATGVWIFVRKMTNTGVGISDDGTPGYRLRLFRALRGSIWVVLVGVLFLLDTFDILSWSHSWPLFIIVAGLMTFFERSTYSAAAPLPYSYPAYPQAAGTNPTPPTSTSVAPVTTHDEEER